MALGADERRDKLRKAAGRGKCPTIRGCLNGGASRFRLPYPCILSAKLSLASMHSYLVSVCLLCVVFPCEVFKVREPGTPEVSGPTERGELPKAGLVTGVKS